MTTEIAAAIEAATLAEHNRDYAVMCVSGVRRMQSELTAAFNLVAPKDHWKNPIDAILEKGFDQSLISDAVVHFTGSVPTFIVARSGRARVQAEGYFRTIGA